MSAQSSIEWTDKTWNPTRGCSVISPGCVNCYAMKFAHRFSAEGKPYAGLTKQTKAGPQWTGELRTVEDALVEPLSWRKPQRVFVNSMSDLFHEDVPDQFIDSVFVVMSLSHRHTFQILTKRADRMRAYMARLADSTRAPGCRDWPQVFDRPMAALTERLGADRMQAICEVPDVSSEWPLPNVWLGVSVEDQKHADARIPWLLQTPAAVRFISAEPLLGPVTLERWLPWNFDTYPSGSRLDWVIVGGESGPSARPFELAWARSIVQQCQSASVPVFVKQVGAKPISLPYNTASWVHQPDGPLHVPFIVDKKGGDPSEWPEDLRVRQFPEVRA